MLLFSLGQTPQNINCIGGNNFETSVLQKSGTAFFNAHYSVYILISMNFHIILYIAGSLKISNCLKIYIFQ